MKEGLRYRIGLATRGYRGAVGDIKYFINQEVELPSVSDIDTSIEISVPQIDIDLGNISVNILSGTVDILVSSDPEISIEDTIETVEIQVDQC